MTNNFTSYSILQRFVYTYRDTAYALEGEISCPYVCSFNKGSDGFSIISVARESGYVEFYKTYPNLNETVLYPYVNIRLHKNAIFAMKWLNNGFQMLTGAADRTLKLYDIEKGCVLHTFEGHENFVRTLDFFDHSPSIVVSGDTDGQLNVYDTRCSKKKGCFMPINIIRAGFSLKSRMSCNAVVGLAAVGNDLIVSCFSGTRDVKLWDIRKHFYKQCVPSENITVPHVPLHQGFTDLALDSFKSTVYVKSVLGATFSFHLYGSTNNREFYQYGSLQKANHFARIALNHDSSLLASTNGNRPSADINIINTSLSEIRVVLPSVLAASAVCWNDYGALAICCDNGKIYLTYPYTAPAPVSQNNVPGPSVLKWQRERELGNTKKIRRNNSPSGLCDVGCAVSRKHDLLSENSPNSKYLKLQGKENSMRLFLKAVT